MRRHDSRGYFGTRMRAGTTVLELVVALVVTGAVAAAGAAAFRQTIDRRTQLLTSSTPTERAAASRALLREWISTATIVWPPSGTGLDFITTARTPIGTPGAPLRLYVDDDPGTIEQGLTLEYRSPVSSTVRRREIDGTITGMVVEYLDASTRQWTTGADSPGVRPLAVRLSFPFENAGSPEYVVSDRLRALPLTIVMPADESPVGPRAMSDTLP